MTVGTKSVLFGAHCFLWHWLFVAWAWWKLYGFPWDPRLWVAFFVHDLGYLGKPNMDGEEGEQHPELGARIMGWLFDYNYPYGDPVHHKWYSFTKYHSRHLAKRDGQPFSKLCVADKLAFGLIPWWMYIPGAYLSREMAEYFVEARKGKLGGRDDWDIHDPDDHFDWFEAVATRLNAWVALHKDGEEDNWTEVREHA